jgi:hypothetical protein
MGPRFRGDDTRREREFYSPSFFLRWPSVRRRSALSLMPYAVQLVSLSSLKMSESSLLDSKPVSA